ncbi:MAG: hypothetical protein KC461_03925 [Dehalococcoidia bacterium]|nr:hypothetical protein [Dehalococcoidia bacterium]MCA9849776.1 hypothetical protein [Dehalococcoidia bacterium]MCB9491026.1 hypothetical protein [Dehalococcoidia bacterium]
MLLAVVCGITLSVVGKALLQQWLSGALTDRTPERAPRPTTLSPIDFPRLAPPARTRPAALHRAVPAASYLRRAA